MKRVDTNTLVAVAALLTSVVAVFIAWDEARLQRQNQRAQFLPIIGIEGSAQTSDDELALKVTLTNRGHGTAQVQSFEIFFGDEPIDTWEGFADSLLTEELAAAADFSWSDPTGYYQPSDRNAVVILRWDQSMRDAFAENVSRSGLERIAQFNVEVCYCSIFEECWTVQMAGDRYPKKLASCPAKPDIIAKLYGEFLKAQNEVNDD